MNADTLSTIGRPQHFDVFFANDEFEPLPYGHWIDDF